MDAANVCDVDDNQRFDCFPENNANEAECIKRGCCWKPASESNEANLNIPYCFYGNGNFGYRVTNKQETDLGFSLDLLLNGPGGPFGGNIKELKADFMFESDTRVHVKILDPANKRYEVPVPTATATSRALNPIYDVEFSQFPFGFAVKRNSTGESIFDTRCGGLVFSDQFLQISSLLPSTNIYGLGEHVLGLKLDTKWTQLSLFSRDIATPEGGVNLYGVHPFYLNVENGGKSNGVFFKNSNAMDIILQPTPAITYRTIGGVLDFYIMLGDRSDFVVQEYNQIIGTPTMPPYWSLGFHLCRYGYNTIENMEKVRARMKANEIPQDVQWNDIDYMDGYKDFTIDEQRFHGLSQFVDGLHNQGMHYILMTDPAISSTQQGYAPYDDGIKADIFIKDDNNEILIGKVWPGLTAFPDFFHPNISEYWFNQINNFHQQINFDGMWIDMNEPSNFVEGSTNGCPQNNLEYPPYVPGIIGGKLLDKTICMSAKQAISTHYNLHSLYGYSEAVQTMSAMKKIRKRRTLVITRSSYSGTGHHAGHWLGDNHSTWSDLRLSIAGILNFNMFGVPMVGADICGFLGDTTEELCSRWMQLGAFYPFSRNHNSLDQRDQDPAAFGQQLIVASKEALRVRYTLLPYLYTLLNNAHRKGNSVARPLFFQYPEDQMALEIDTQFMWGSGLLFSPVLQQGARSVTAYFPKDRWYEYYKGSIIDSNGENIVLPASFETVNLHIRGDSVIPTQKAELTTTESRKNPYDLIVALNETGHAHGTLYIDDGDQLIDDGLDNTTNIEFICAQNVLTSTPQRTGYVPLQNTLQNIAILGVVETPTSVVHNGDKIDFLYDKNIKKLSITLNKACILDKNIISWS